MNNQSAVAAVIPAAGIGSRMNLAMPKQYLTVAGQTILQHSVAALAQDPRIQLIIIAIAADDLVAKQLEFGITTPVQWVAGGATRAASVAAGVDVAQQQGFKFVAVHDAARPCLQADELAAVLTAGMQHKDGALLALPVADSLKRATSSNASAAQPPEVVASVPREQLWRAQTPQVFATAHLWRALQQVGINNPAITDEASAIELIGGRPQLVTGRATNIKVTQPGDEALAAMYLSQNVSKTE